MLADRIRCLYCDFVGIRIVHPIEEEFHGRQVELEKMVCGEDPCDEELNPALFQPFYTNTRIIRHSRLVANEIGVLEEDCLYADSFDQPRNSVALQDLEFMMDGDFVISGDPMTDGYHISN